MAGYNEIVLAAWLHDIGKFAKRAGDEYFKDLDGRSHVSYTERFLHKVRDCLPTAVLVDDVIRLAAAHHNPDAYDEWLIAHGDRLSNGADKCHIDTEGGNRGDGPRAEFAKPLVHLVSSLHIKEKARPKVAYSPLKPMEGKAIFAGDKDKVSPQEYKDLWGKFDGDFHALKGLPYSDFMQSLDMLMERYCWCVPSSPAQDAESVPAFEDGRRLRGDPVPVPQGKGQRRGGGTCGKRRTGLSFYSGRCVRGSEIHFRPKDHHRQRQASAGAEFPGLGVKRHNSRVPGQADRRFEGEYRYFLWREIPSACAEHRKREREKAWRAAA